MTNLLAAIVITVVTNTTEELPWHWEVDNTPNVTVPGAYGGITMRTLECHMKRVNDPDAKIKRVTTTVKELATLRFDWNGPREIVQEKVLWETNAVFALETKSEWKPSSQPFPAFPSTAIGGYGLTLPGTINLW